MYDFLTKKKLKKRAQAGHIQTYRAMLSERQVPASGWVAINPQELAEDQLYILLDYYSIEEIEDFESRTRKLLDGVPFSYTCVLKYDGVAIGLTYKKGKLIQAVTRGNGTVGDDITSEVLNRLSQK